jgi:ankyrin repeat protein
MATAGLELTDEAQLYGWTPLHVCAHAGHEAATRALVDAKADMAAKTRWGFTALHLAASEGPLDEAGEASDDDEAAPSRCGAAAATVLINAGADLEDTAGIDGRTALGISAQKGQEGVVRVLVDAGANLEAKRGPYGMTPLHDAAVEGRAGVVAILVEAGANVATVTIDGRDISGGKTALHFAALFHREKCASVLVAAGAEVSAKDLKSRTPLHGAMDGEERDCHEGVAKVLLAGGADVDSQDARGDTPLHLVLALHYDSLGCVKLLLDAGANWEIQNKRGASPLKIARDVARSHGDKNVAVSPCKNNTRLSCPTPLHCSVFLTSLHYRGTSLTRKRPPLRPYSSLMPRAQRWS